VKNQQKWPSPTTWATQSLRASSGQEELSQQEASEAKASWFSLKRRKYSMRSTLDGTFLQPCS
jgi:hypothetical protein